MIHHHRMIKVEEFEPYIGAQAVERILHKAKRVNDLHITHVNSTYYGGGVAIFLSSLSLLMNQLGVKTGWRVIQGMPDFFSITKKMHHALQGSKINLSARKKMIYEDVVFENSLRNHLEHHDVVIVHDPQPLPLINCYKKKMAWVWRCHVDLTHPDKNVWNYLRQFIDKYDAAVVSMEEYRQKLNINQLVFTPSIDPFIIKNKELPEKEIKERLSHYKIPTDLPLVVQVSRFDKWKDPEGVIKAFKIARKKVDCTLVLIGNAATDDPEGQEIYDSLLKHREDRIIISHFGDDSALINALQKKAAVVIQKSLKEGFGLTVAEAMWKGTPVIGGNVGGIRHQIEDGVNGFLVNSVEECAERMIAILKNKDMRNEMGIAARETVRKKFLITRSLEEDLDLIYSLKMKHLTNGKGTGES